MPPKQVVLFGSPGVGKSYLVEHTLLPELGVNPQSEDCIKAVFHPEYTYGDFMGKLVPYTRDKKPEYNYYEGHFLRALGRAYRAILENPEAPAHVALVIDELNRGNSSAIFGAVFQLLDRDDAGWSNYHVDISEMEWEGLVRRIGIQTMVEADRKDRITYQFKGKTHQNLDELLGPIRVRRSQIRIPGNLSIIATINTSDTSIYYMDAAFKRRWEWEFVDLDSKRLGSADVVFASRAEWESFVGKLNGFIRANSTHVRNLEDKQLGYWFIKSAPVTVSQIQNKLLFFLWDSVFTRDRKPLLDLLKVTPQQLSTFGDFARRSPQFVDAIKGRV
jgi:5-methylcytosine-specific restriction endonuclease McrBC GTP-binding regulatory subunit McrB